PIQHPIGPRISRRGFATVKIGTGRVAVEYGRPRRRNRTVWGKLVPWDRPWTPGADEGTVFTSSSTITMGDLEVGPGEYALYALPTAKDLTLILSADIGAYHNVFRPTQEVGRVRTDWIATPGIEELTIEFLSG